MTTARHREALKSYKPVNAYDNATVDADCDASRSAGANAIVAQAGQSPMRAMLGSPLLRPAGANPSQPARTTERLGPLCQESRQR